MKNLSIIFLSLITRFILCITFIISFIFVMWVCIWLSEKPEICSEEFPFVFEYEIDGEIITVEDSLIYKYDGAGFSAATMSFERQWDYSLESGNTRITLLETQGDYICFNPGLDSTSANFYMGDNTIRDYDWSRYSFYFTKQLQSARPYSRHFISNEELWDEYKIKIIKFEITPPIENSFPS